MFNEFFAFQACQYVSSTLNDRVTATEVGILPDEFSQWEQNLIILR